MHLRIQCAKVDIKVFLAVVDVETLEDANLIARHSGVGLGDAVLGCLHVRFDSV